MIRILGKPECPHCWKLRLALSEAGIPHHSLAVDPADEQNRETLNRYSPQGTVPVLTDGEVVLWDSSIMIEYVADLGGPGVDLFPGNAAARARARNIQHYSDTIAGPALQSAIYKIRHVPKSERRKDKAADGWLGCQAHLEKLLGDRTFFAGDAFSVAECALAPRFGLAERYGVGVTTKFPNLVRWFAALKARPSYGATLPDVFSRPTAKPAKTSGEKRPFRGIMPPT